MRYFKNIFVLSLAASLFSACSTAPKVEPIAAEIKPAEAKKQPPAPAETEIKDIRGSSGKVSWAEYKTAMQALEADDPLAAVYYFDLALGEVYTEKQADSLGLPDDSAYFAAMPKLILSSLESLYPRLISQSSELSIPIQNDYENYYYEDIDSFEETPLDSAEKVAIENFLDTMDLSRFSVNMVINERVMQEIHYLTVNARNFTEGSLSRKTILDSMIYEKLKEQNMPADLVYLAFVESGFKHRAYSRAKAAGIWQFIPGTGKRYGLPVDFWVDMRFNPEKATDAALRYLSDLYAEFGDWHLAMAAYNCGEGRIRRLVRDATATDPAKKVSYWNLKLPRETMHYVPRILAATVIGHFPEQYSFKVEKQSSLPSDTVTIKDCIPLDKVGSSLGVSLNTIRDLNPELTRWCTPPNLKSYQMRVPKGSREKFLAAYEKMDKTQLVRWQQYKVRKGDNLGNISRIFGLKVSDIQAANNLRSTKLSIGQTLIIPMPAGANPPSSQKQIEKSGNKPEEKSPRFYVVRNGDNLSSISRRFGISSQTLIEWNDLQNNKITVGQRLYLQDPLKNSEKKTQAVANKADISSSPGPSYIVKDGDNLWDIARNHNVTVQQLTEWNPGINKKIYPGMKIKVAP